jgi:OOP family OmpA-OmpF porin
MRLASVLLASSLLASAIPAAASDRGFYVGAGFGEVNTEVDDVLGSDYNFDESNFGFKLFGGYRFFPWLSVEGAYIDGGDPHVKVSDADESLRLGISVQSLVAAAVFSLPVGDRFEFFVKPGLAYWDSTTSVDYSSPGFVDRFQDDDSGSAFFLGVGASNTNGSTSHRSTTATGRSLSTNWTHPPASSR